MGSLSAKCCITNPASKACFPRLACLAVPTHSLSHSLYRLHGTYIDHGSGLMRAGLGHTWAGRDLESPECYI